MSLYEDEKKPKCKNSLTDAQRGELVLSHEKLCRQLANKTRRKFAGNQATMSIEDLTSEAFLACVEASQYFDPNRGSKFITFATQWIQRHLSGVLTKGLAGAVVNLPGDFDQPDKSIIEDEKNECVPHEPDEETRILLGNLNEQQRAVVSGIVIDRLLPEQVAELLNIPVKDVKIIIRNACKHLTQVQKRQALGGLF